MIWYLPPGLSLPPPHLLPPRLLPFMKSIISILRRKRFRVCALYQHDHLDTQRINEKGPWTKNSNSKVIRSLVYHR